MKLPSPDLRSLTDLLVRHGEKAVVAIVGLVALALAWGAVDALRSQTVSPTQEPKAIEQVVSQASGHIGLKAEPPADLLPPREPLATAIDPWRRPLVPWRLDADAPSLEIAKAPVVAVLDSPLFDERPKRGQPEVLPVEDLRAVAGIAVVPAPDAVAPPGPGPRPGAGPGLAGPPPPRPDKPDTKPDKKPEGGAAPGRRPPRGADPLAGGAPEPREMPAQVGPVRDRGRIVPYVVVTGLIPMHKQQDEYRRQFAACGIPNEQRRDSPLWCDYEIDRLAIGADGKESWTRLDLAAIARRRATEWGKAAAIGVDATYLLGASDESRSKETPIGFCSAVPRRLDGTWELADLHPWVVDRLAAKLADVQRQEREPAMEPVEPGAGREGPGFGQADDRQPEPRAPDVRAESPEYRLFRFIDTAVEPGATYRYRVRLKVYNPNFDEEPDRMRPYLADPALAVNQKLTSPDSAPSPAATVPATTRVVVDTLQREELKELKIKPGSGTVEVLVLGPSAVTGSFALRGLVADPGAVVDVDEEINKRYRNRARGETIGTQEVLVDARGRQEDRLEGPAEKEKPPGAIPEPFEVLCVRTDGSFEVASLDGSERAVADYRDTLPARGSRTEAGRTEAPDPMAPDGRRPTPPDDPLARPRAGR